MKDLTWPGVVVFTGVVAAIVVMFGLANDDTTRKHLLGYFDTIVPFIVGAAAGAAAGGTVGFLKGAKLI